jgi:molybdopterin synthase sulfur carrier subunit
MGLQPQPDLGDVAVGRRVLDRTHVLRELVRGVPAVDLALLVRPHADQDALPGHRRARAAAQAGGRCGKQPHRVAPCQVLAGEPAGQGVESIHGQPPGQAIRASYAAILEIQPPGRLQQGPALRDDAAMPTVHFTPQLRRFVDAPSVQTSAGHLRAALEDAFAGNPRLRGYVLDDQGHLRANVVVFVDGERSQDRQALVQALAPASQVHVLQALSGG